VFLCGVCVCVCVCVCPRFSVALLVVSLNVSLLVPFGRWSWSVLLFALQDLKIALANTPRVHPLFVLYCIVYYKSVYDATSLLFLLAER
jgi:hypothetical protein